MPNPTIAPAVWAADATYTVTDSGFAAIDLNIADIDEEAAQVLLTVPVGGDVAVLRDPVDWAGAGTPILAGGAWTGAPVALGDWQVSVTPGAAVTDQATVSVISGTSGAGGLLRVVLTGLGGQATGMEPGGGTISIDRVLAEPGILNVQVASGLPVREKDAVTLAASVFATVAENGAPSAPLPPLPTLLSSWSENPANTIALSNFIDLGMTATFTAPPVYAVTNLSFIVTGALDLDASGTVGPGDPQTAEALQFDVQLVRYGIVLVLDRSGSMGSSLGGGLSKWDAATQAAHAWTDLFRAFRPGGEHVVGVVTFEHDNCSWTPTPAGDITFREPANGAPSAGLVALESFGNVNTWDLGQVESCTPIGDGLVTAWQGIGAALGPSDVGAVILMTDGYENAGRVTIAETAGPASTTFDAERMTPALQVPDDLIGDRLYTLAIGTSVDEDRLNDLGSAYYQQITTDLAEVKPAFAAMLGDVLDAQEQTPEPPLAGDPEAPSNPLYYRVSPAEQTLAFLVTWTSITDSLRIGWRPQGGSGPFTLIDPSNAAVTETSRGTHGLMRIDLHGLFAGPPPATEWRLQHLDNGSTPLPLPAADALVMVDLVTSAEVGFDWRQYFIGDEIKLSCRIRRGGVPVTDATVGVDCARPGEGLGTFLTTHAGRYKKIKPDAALGPDPNQGKGLMFKTLLSSLEMDDLPIVTPPQFQLFDDGAHGDGPAGNGDFANAFADTAKEGTYTFRFRIEGKLADGSRFSRIFVRSTWVGVRPDPALLDVVWTVLDETVGGRPVSLATFKPRTAKNEFLGPFRTAVIDRAVHDGVLDGPLIDNEDGSYSQRVVHDTGVDPILEIDIYGRPMKPTGPAIVRGSAAAGDKDCWRLWLRAICCTLAWFRKLIFGR